MVKYYRERTTFLIPSIFLFLIVIIFFANSAQATSASADPNLAGNPNGGVDMWYMSPQSYRKAGLNIENPYHNPYIVVGVQMMFNLSEAPGYKAKVVAQRGSLGEDQDAMIEHQITGFRYGNEKTQQFLFTEEEYLIVDTDYNIQMRPLRADHLTLQHTEAEGNNSFYWDPDTGDWATHDDLPNSPDITGKEWKMDALVEPVSPLIKNMPKPETMVAPDAVDAFYADLTLGKTYVFFLDHSEQTNFQMYVYSDRDALGTPGKLIEDTLIDSTSGSENEKNITITASYNGRHYIVVRPKTGSGTYELEFRENRAPVAIAQEDVYANLPLGGSVEVKLTNTGSYDPDDDANGNERIDGTEDNNLKYYWDLDDTVDGNDDGDYTNDRDATGQTVLRTFEKGGSFTATLTVEDPFGASDSAEFKLYVNYIPVIKITIDMDGEAFVDNKITFSAEGSYDPDDDLDGNGIIDGSEVDHLNYSWDFYDKIDKNMDGNFTNDTDASNKMWLMKYPKEGEYTITLNVWDNPESADRAYNFTQVVVDVVPEPPEWPEEMIDAEGDIVRDPKAKENKDLTNDVFIRTKRGAAKPTIEVSAYSQNSYDTVNLVRISTENDDNVLIMKLITKGLIMQEATKTERIFYSFYIVGKGFAEPALDVNGNAGTMEYYYNFTFFNGAVTARDTTGEIVDVGKINLTIEYDGTALVLRIPMHKLRVLIEAVWNEGGDADIFDIFAVALYTSTRTEAAETVKVYARDSMGTGGPEGTKSATYPKDWFPEPEVPPDIISNGNGDGTEHGLTILLLSTGSAFILFITGFFLYTRIKRKRILDNRTRQMIYAYVIRNPGTHYSRIRNDLNISGNTLSHHVRKLREAELVRTRTEGNFKFIYPSCMSELGCQVTPVQKKIVSLLRTMEGATVKEIAKRLGKRPRTIRYHIGNLEDIGVVKSSTDNGAAVWFADSAWDEKGA